VSESREVIVIGGGMAGLTAALATAEAGGDVLVLESESSVGGSMAISGGLIWSPATFELARRWIPRGDPELQRILVDELEDAWSWFEEHGLPLDPPVACLKDRMGRGRLMTVGGPGARGPWAEILLGAAQRQGAEVRTAPAWIRWNRAPRDGR
jgi:glycine/D-amino acid oxidase-like deaminating enzyme